MASRLGTVLRRFASTGGIEKGPGPVAAHAGGMRRWKLLSFLVAIPGVVVCWANAYIGGGHEEHCPEFVAYEHLRLRSKKFPWGDGNHTLFHNRHTNPLPEGYEQ